MKNISCASYYGSGSSAIVDYLSEFSNVKSLTNYEFRFVHDPYGISDLEYNLVENHNRHNSGHALKRYKWLVDYYGDHLFVRRYEPFFENKWKKISYDYIDQLTDFTYHGSWQYDYIDKGRLFEFLLKLPNRIMHKTIWRNNPDRNVGLLRKEITYCSRPSDEKFLRCTQDYIDQLLMAANPDDKPFLVVDQIVPPSNLSRYLRYFSNLWVFVVDRDPRDIFLLSKYVWHDSVIPKESIELYCKWFRYTRAHRQVDKWDPRKVKFLRFEDLVYTYDAVTKEIGAWLGLSEVDHIKKYKYFDPQISINNTQLWKKCQEYEEEARQIARLLPEFLYTFPSE